MLLQTCYDEISDFPPEVEDTLAYQHGLCMKKDMHLVQALNTPTNSRLHMKNIMKNLIFVRKWILEDESYI